MKSILQSFRYLKGYENRVVLNMFFTLLVSILEIVSLVSVLPFLRIALSPEDIVQPEIEKEPFHLLPFNELGSQFDSFLNHFMYDLSLSYSKTQMLTMICVFVFVVFLLKNIFTYINKMIERSIHYNVAKDLRSKVYNKVLLLPISQFNEQRRGDILTRFSNDILKMENTVLNGFVVLFKEPILILFYLLSMLVISSKLTLFTLVLIPTLGVLIGQITRSLRKKSTAYQNKISQLISYLDETMFGAKVIKSFTGEQFVHERFEKENQALKQIHKKIHIRRAASSPISEVMGIGLVLIVLWFGGRLILGESSSALTGEGLILFIFLFARLITPVKALTNQYTLLQDGLSSADRIDELLAKPVEYEQIHDGEERYDFKKNVIFKTVSFSYPDSQVKVLNKLNLSIPKGSVTALVGQSGAGKSTIADLLPRFFDVTDGEILIDDKNINSIPLHQLRSLFSYVSQEAILFHDTVRNNIAFGMNNVTDEDIIRAAKIANAHDFIIQLENGYDTSLGERGSKLSGGQRQRITIARAILKDAPILILDEATSALDTESERLVQDAIEHLLENRTALVIAHRLSTIKNADNICVIDAGQVVEQGTHDELLKKPNGQYKLLTELQAV